jgi:hypothetical protein
MDNLRALAKNVRFSVRTFWSRPALDMEFELTYAEILGWAQTVFPLATTLERVPNREHFMACYRVLTEDGNCLALAGVIPGYFSPWFLPSGTTL